MPIMVARDINHESVGTGMLFARVVPSKGVQPYAVKSLSADIAPLGYSEFVFKSDNEPSIVALKDAVKLERPERIVMEASPVHESKSNSSKSSTRLISTTDRRFSCSSWASSDLAESLRRLGSDSALLQ